MQITNKNLSSKFQLILKSSSKESLFVYISFLKSILNKLNLNNFTLFYLPKTKSRFTLLKSPHVNKKAKEQFEITYYKILITFKNLVIHINILKYLLLNKPKCINIKIKS